MTELSAIAWIVLTAAIVAVAFVYSSVGHGGATGYLAVLALAGVAPDSARGAALLTNCFVAGVAWWRFSQAGHFDRRVLLWLIAASVPCAWLGSRVELPRSTYSVLLGGVLVAAGICLLTRKTAVDGAPLRPPAVPLLLGCEPQEWPALLARKALAEAANALTTQVARDLGCAEDACVDTMALRAWAERRQLALPPALRALLDFIARTLPARAEVPQDARPAHAAAAVERERVLGAALALVTRFPERYRDAQGFYDTRLLAESIVDKAVLWFETGRPLMTLPAMTELLAAYLDSAAPAPRPLIG